MIAALFDFDGTLYTGHIWQDLVRHHWTAKQNRRWVVAYLARNMATLPLYRTKLQSEADYFSAWARTMAWLMRGWTLAEAQALFEHLTDELIIPNLRPDILARLQEHQARGHLVALVSGTFAPWLQAVAGRMGVSHAIGTPLAVREGAYTGRIVPPLCQGPGKPERTRLYLGERGLEIDWDSSYAYADRMTDLPLMDQVGQPLAVYPDDALASHASAQGWPILGEVRV
jgi:putative phosphoserine phosphatase/1-acylglycerol-3-phosphate O-acyltransferase